MNYDKNLLCTRFKEIRTDRKELYLKNKEENSKYEYCLTQEAFACAVGADRRTIIKWEQGETIPSLEYLLKICDLLDCNFEYFLGIDDLPYIDTTAKASHFTGIDPRIIEYANKNPDYLECLNFFMLPENCSELFNKITLSAWKKYWINQSLSDIKPPLIDIIEKAFTDFYSFTPFTEISIDKYKEYLIEYLPIEKINFEPTPDSNFPINLKEVFFLRRYIDCKKNLSSANKYNSFIDYIAQLTYEPLTNKEFIEIQKQKVANKFIDILSLYLSDL